MSQPARPALIAIMRAMDIVVEMAQDPQHYEEMAAERNAMIWIMSCAKEALDAIEQHAAEKIN